MDFLARLFHPVAEAAKAFVPKKHETLGACLAVALRARYRYDSLKSTTGACEITELVAAVVRPIAFVIPALLLAGAGHAKPAVANQLAAGPARAFVSRAESPPRKVVIGTVKAHGLGGLSERLEHAVSLIDDAAREASKTSSGRGLDLMVLPEYAIRADDGPTAAERGVGLQGEVLTSLGAAARAHRTWLVVSMMLRETGEPERYSNAAVLLDRAGQVAGIYRKVHPVIDKADTLEGGVTPGSEYPVFECDFGRLGILICWDMGFDEAWEALAAAGAEIVAIPTASPQTVRPMSEALRHRGYVVTSTRRNNASIFNPIGLTVAQTTTEPILVHEIDLAYALVNWKPRLQDGRAFTDRFGAKVGYTYSAREDHGVFWSNDPKIPVATMVRELGFEETPVFIERTRRAQDEARRSANNPVRE